MNQNQTESKPTTPKKPADKGLDGTICSRIADPEGKHLEICRIQLARTVKQRDELAAMIERFAEDVDGQGDEIWAKQLRLHVREIYSENV